MNELFILVSFMFWAMTSLATGISAGIALLDCGDTEKGMAYFMACLFSMLMAILAGASAHQLGLMFT